MADDIPSVAPMPGIASDREIVKQALEGLRESQDRIAKSMEAMRHDRPNGSWWAKYGPTILSLSVSAVVAYAMFQINQSATTAREEQAAASKRITTIEDRSRDNAFAVDRIDRDRASRSATVDGKLDALDRRVAPVEALVKDVARLEKSAETLDLRLTNGREERIADNEKIVDAVNASKTELALLRQELQQTRSLIEGQRAPPPFRRPSMLRFDMPRIMLASAQHEAPFVMAQSEPAGAEIAASIEEDRSEIARMRGWLRSMRETIAAGVGRRPEPKFDGDDDEALPPMRRARPEVREVEPRIERKAEAPRRMAKKKRWRGRSSTAFGFTRALERAFGRPYYKGPYWLSLNSRARRGR